MQGTDVTHWVGAFTRNAGLPCNTTGLVRPRDAKMGALRPALDRFVAKSGRRLDLARAVRNSEA